MFIFLLKIKVKGHTSPVTADDIQVLPYVRATIQEAIRLKGSKYWCRIQEQLKK